MKIIKFIFSSFLALILIACTGIFIFFQTFDTDQFLPQITKKASLVIGRPVSIGGVGLGLSSRGITLDVGDLIVGDDTDYTTQPFIKVDKVRLSLDLRYLILQRKIHITNVLLQSPQIHFIRSLEGNFNARSIARRSVKRSNTIDIAEKVPSLPSASVEAVPNTMPAAPHSDAILSKAEGLGIEIRDGAISFIDQNQTFPLDIWLNGINANLNDFSLSKPFQLSFDASLLSDIPNMRGGALVSFGADGFGIKFSDLKLDTDLSRTNMGMLKGISPGMSDHLFFKTIAGIVQLNMAHLEFGVTGLSADGNISITGGVIKDFNMIKTVLSHSLRVFGGVEVNIEHLLTGQLKSQLEAPDTDIKKAEVEFSIHDRSVFIEDSLIETNLFELKAKGSIDQGLNTDIQTMLHLDQDLSAALVNELDGFKLLCDDSKRIAIGASLQGVIPHLKYKPNKDFRKKSKKALMQEGGNILGILLGGAQTSLQDQDTSSQENKKVKKDFKNIFKSLLQ